MTPTYFWLIQVRLGDRTTQIVDSNVNAGEASSLSSVASGYLHIIYIHVGSLVEGGNVRYASFAPYQDLLPNL